MPDAVESIKALGETHPRMPSVTLECQPPLVEVSAWDFSLSASSVNSLTLSWERHRHQVKSDLHQMRSKAQTRAPYHMPLVHTPVEVLWRKKSCGSGLTLQSQKAWKSFSVGFPDGSVGKESTHNEGDTGSIPGLGRYPGERNGDPLHYSCLKNLIDRGVWLATVRGVTKSQAWLSK